MKLRSSHNLPELAELAQRKWARWTIAEVLNKLNPAMPYNTRLVIPKTNRRLEASGGDGSTEPAMLIDFHSNERSVIDSIRLRFFPFTTDAAATATDRSALPLSSLACPCTAVSLWEGDLPPYFPKMSSFEHQAHGRMQHMKYTRRQQQSERRVRYVGPHGGSGFQADLHLDAWASGTRADAMSSRNSQNRPFWVEDKIFDGCMLKKYSIPTALLEPYSENILKQAAMQHRDLLPAAPDGGGVDISPTYFVSSDLSQFVVAGNGLALPHATPPLFGDASDSPPRGGGVSHEHHTLDAIALAHVANALPFYGSLWIEATPL